MKNRIAAILAVLVSLLVLSFISAPADASTQPPPTVTSCTAEGLAGTVQYGQCATNLSGAGSVTFYHGGAFVTVAQNGAAFWSTNGPLAGSPTRVCANFALSLSRRAAGEQDLVVSYNGGEQVTVKRSIWSGLTKVCAALPAGAVNVWAQLITIATPSAWSRQSISESWFGFTAS